jgi:predicted AAA+ superfamily ATPase
MTESVHTVQDAQAHNSSNQSSSVTLHEQHSSAHTNEDVLTAVHAIHGLALLKGVLANEAGQSMLHLLLRLVSPTREDPLVIASTYAETFGALTASAQRDTTPALSDAWQAHVVAHLIDDANLWSAQVERLGIDSVSPNLRAQAQRDLRALQRLFHLEARHLWKLTCQAVAQTMPILHDAWSPWHDLAPLNHDEHNPARQELVQTILACSDWSELTSPLEEYWSRYGTGPLAHYHALRWQSHQQQLQGIAHPDPISLNSLIGHERQQARLTSNIERFLSGLPAHDMLLYGAPGTGKSSTIKALANAYSTQGLCLVELHKEDVNDLPVIIDALRDHAPRYLLFIDDLSFEEHETSYKALKVLLEGTIEARPSNILVCATSNRMNLVKENFSERGKPTDDVNWRDSMDEKQSLVHRFGLRVTFMTPDQQHYLRIVAGLAAQRGLELPTEELQSRALQWERQHSGRSGRVARQFVDDLEAELKSLVFDK